MIGDANRALRIGILSDRNIESEWASTHAYIVRALRGMGAEVAQIGAPPIASRLFRWVRGNPPLENSFRLRPGLLSALRKESHRPDIYLNLHCSTVTPHVRLPRPFGYVTDATPELMHNYYDSHRNTTLGDFRYLEECERATVAQAAAIIVPTQWAAASIIDDYAADPERVHVVEWGANCDAPSPEMLTPRPMEAIRQAPRLLFVGLDWARKGGDLAVEAVASLAQRGLRPELHVVGADVPRSQRAPFVQTHGRLSRSIPQQKAKLDELYRQCDFALHPARAECYGHVLCEAQAHGLPVISIDTGGISQCVTDNVTGRLLAEGVSGAAIAECIHQLLRDDETYVRLRENALNAFRERLNWDAWGKRTLELMARAANNV